MIDKEFAIEILKQYREKPTLINEINTVEEAVWLDESLAMATKALKQTRWISVNTMLPNEDEIYYDGVEIDGERKVSDRVLAVDETGWIRIGYFIKSCKKHQYNGKRVRNKYSDYGVASWEFGNNYEDKKENWIVEDSKYVPIAWMPLPKSYKVESEDKECV